jgi:peptide/nickel transport system substrate-binding protein
MAQYKRWSLLITVGLLGIAALVAQVQEEEESMLIVIETIEVAGGETIEVTRIVTEVQVVTPTPATEAHQPKNLIVCVGQEPDTLYPFGSAMPAARAVQHALFDDLITYRNFSYQPSALEKVPSLADGDAVLQPVAVGAGDRVVSESHGVVVLAEAGRAVLVNGLPAEGAVVLRDSSGEEVVWQGERLSMGQLVVDYRLKPLVYSDGVPVTAADSVYTFKLVSDPDTPVNKFLPQRTASYEATGDLAVRWTGLPGFIYPHYFQTIWTPYPRHVWGQFTAAELLELPEATRPSVSHGPFRLVEWVPGERIELVRNEHYWRPGLPHLDSVTFRFLPGTGQLVAQLLTGQCHIGTEDLIGPEHYPLLVEAENNQLLAPVFNIRPVFEHIDFNINPADDRPRWFEDVRVRRAMLICTDRETMAEDLLYGRSPIMHTYLPTTHPLYPEADRIEWPYDVDMANALLDEAGFMAGEDGIRRHPETGEGFRVTLDTTSGNRLRLQLSRLFRSNMRDCGIEVALNYLPTREWFADGPEGPLFGRRFDLALFAWPISMEPACQLYQAQEIPTAENDWRGQNVTGWHSESFSTACNAALQALPGTAEYRAAHEEAQRIFANDAPIIPLFPRLKVAVARPEVTNFGVDSTQTSELFNIYEMDLVP